MLSSFFSSFTIYADAPDEKEGKVEEPAAEEEEETATEEEEEEPEDVTLNRFLHFTLNAEFFGGRFIPL